MKILIVCASNICRSPYVEYLLKRTIEGDELLKDNIEWVKSSAVFNKMIKIHPKTRVTLSQEGFKDSEIDAHRPTYLWFNYKRFMQADIIIGMTKTQKYLLPIWLYHKYKTLSQVAGHNYIKVRDPYLEKTQEGFDEVMGQIKGYVEEYIQLLKDKFPKENQK